MVVEVVMRPLSVGVCIIIIITSLQRTDDRRSMKEDEVETDGRFFLHHRLRKCRLAGDGGGRGWSDRVLAAIPVVICGGATAPHQRFSGRCKPRYFRLHLLVH